MDKSWLEEQRRVDFVIDEIGKRMDHLQQAADKNRTDIVSIRKNFWDNVTVNFDDPLEAIETAASIKQQAEVLSESERVYQHNQKQLVALEKLRRSPYFGRIDFLEKGFKKAESIYLGVASFLDEDQLEFLVYDWRAPISSIYYDYLPGPASYDTPGGTARGTLELKRQYIIRDGQIQSLFDTGVTIGDQLLQEVLGKQSDAQMKSIVATIQKEQNQIIRNERSELLIVQGSAGSGKTSAALQRVAYLLYRYRGKLLADQIVLFSPNPMFNSYISTVLPELGEENMQQTTFQEYLERRLGSAFSLEDPFTQMEFVLTAMDMPGYVARIAGIQYKASLDFLQTIEDYIAFLGKEGLLFKEILFQGEVLISAEQIRKQFYAYDTNLPISNRMALLATALIKQLKELARDEAEKAWVEDEVELLGNEAYRWAYKELRKKKQYDEGTFDDFESEKALLSERVVEKHFKPLYECVKSFQFIDAIGIYQQLFAHPEFVSEIAVGAKLPESWASICKHTMERLAQKELLYEDATPYLYLKERLEGFHTKNTIRHVFIDEAQDYSPFQFAFIKRLFPRSKMTVLGDWNQAIFAHTAENSGFKALPALFGTDRMEQILLSQSYRSTKPIVEFTRELVEGGEMIEPFQREGGKPTLLKLEMMDELEQKVVERVMGLQSSGYGTIAVICKTANESLEVYERLKSNLPVLLVDKETISFEKGIVVIPAYLAKGVEFDAVIIYNASTTQYSRESERKLLYTACTRAMHELHLFCVGQLTPLIPIEVVGTLLVEVEG
ncbi:RNA polymerase recycling motor HelD [Ammoniphilus resinae]|nr:RNA polymerase recycling motor HelD [Ammoniphilus resinae]